MKILGRDAKLVTNPTGVCQFNKFKLDAPMCSRINQTEIILSRNTAPTPPPKDSGRLFANILGQFSHVWPQIDDAAASLLAPIFCQRFSAVSVHGKQDYDHDGHTSSPKE